MLTFEVQVGDALRVHMHEIIFIFSSFNLQMSNRPEASVSPKWRMDTLQPMSWRGSYRCENREYGLKLI